MKNQKGITLIALVVTIVVLIILAAVSIDAVFSENGLIKQAEKAKEHQANAVASDEEAMDEYLQQYANIMADPPEPEVYEDTTLPTTPNVAEGMKRVKWNGSNWVEVTDDSEEWYDYSTSSKEWANVVLSDATITDGVLDESAAYSQLVWIPRFAYKITSQYHTSGSTAGNIEIVFIDTENKDSAGNTYSTTYPSATTGGGMEDYVVHPAFNYGDTKLEGFWVGKFESSNTSCTTTASTGNVTYTGSEVMTIKAGVTSWRNITIGNAFATCLAMNNNSVYGLSSDDTVVDPHMMKNTEWGAVAYLTQSSYGKNSEVWINNNSNYITGQAGDSVSASSSSSTNAYTTTNGMQASTTGNVTGIYDMSGGNWERVAAYVNNGNSNLTTYGGNLVASDTASRYRDIYSVGSSDSLAANYAVSTPANGHYGDAVYETCADTINTSSYASSWYSDYSYFPGTSYPFFYRGGYYNFTSIAGMFCFNSYSGEANTYIGFRVVVPVL